MVWPKPDQLDRFLRACGVMKFQCINCLSYTHNKFILNALLELVHVSRLTVVSREAKKKQHACASSGPRDHYSELFTWMAALKF